MGQRSRQWMEGDRDWETPVGRRGLDRKMESCLKGEAEQGEAAWGLKGWR